MFINIKNTLQKVIFVFIIFTGVMLTAQAQTYVETNRYNTYSNSSTTYTNSPVTYTPTNWNIPNTWNGPVSPSIGYGNTNSYPRITCPINYTISGTSCIPNKKKCNNGGEVAFYEECTKTCWGGLLDGQSISENLTCPTKSGSTSDNTYAAPKIKCSSGQYVSEGDECEKICPNGAMVPESEVCPTQIKICNSGKVVGYNNLCTKKCENGSVINEIETCSANSKSISTLQASNILDTSARCNAIAITGDSRINGTSYFEYGVQGGVGNTLRTNIGVLQNANKYNITNAIDGLEPNTKYYCRAVMLASGITYKGDMVTFKTIDPKYLNNQKVIVKEINTTITKEIKTTDATSNSPKVQAEINTKSNSNNNLLTSILNLKQNVLGENKDSASTSSVKNPDVIETENPSGKDLKLSIIRVTEKLKSGEDAIFKLSYSNSSKVDIDNVIITINTPSDLTYISSTNGDYVLEDRLLTINIGKVNSGATGDVLVTYKVNQGIVSGTNIIMNAKGVYDISGDTKENSAYLISTISSDITSNVKVENEGLFSNVIFRLLISLILILLLFMLGRNIYQKIMHQKIVNKILGMGKSKAH